MLSRDQEHAEAFLATGRLLADAFAAPDEYRMREVLLCLDGAIASFGRMEMVARQLGRDDLGTSAPSGWSLETALARFNDGGLASLQAALDHLEQFRVGFPDAGGERVDAREVESRAAAFEDGVRYELSQLELKPADVEKLVRQLEEATGVARLAKPDALIEHVQAKVRELAEARGSADRGMVDNLPWWKIVAVAVYFGISTWALMKCTWGWRGRSCTPMEALIYSLIAKAASLGVKLC